MTTLELKADIQKAVQNTDDKHLLETISALLHINTKPETFDMYQVFSMVKDRKAVFDESPPKKQMATAIKNKILENLEK